MDETYEVNVMLKSRSIVTRLAAGVINFFLKFATYGRGRQKGVSKCINMDVSLLS